MKITERDFVPASELAKRNGIKQLFFGQAGTGKTPLIKTMSAWHPVILKIENGFAGMTDSNIPTWEAQTPERIEAFIDWRTGSAEAAKYGVTFIDSGSELASVYLAVAEAKTTSAGNANTGKQAYGEMWRKAFPLLKRLYTTPGNIVIICKEERLDTGLHIPAFPGPAMKRDVTHLYDWIARIGMYTFQGVQYRQLQNFNDNIAACRDRTMRLAPYEEADLDACFRKLIA